MKMKFSIVSVLVFLILSCFAVAVNDSETLPPFKITLEVVKERIDFDENAVYKITIENPRDSVETFSIKPGAPYVEWFIKTDPASDYNIKVYPGTKKEVKLIVKPLSVGIGRYSLRINANNLRTKEVLYVDIPVNVISINNLPALGVSANIPEKIDPQKEFLVRVWLENKNAKRLDDLNVELRSDVFQESAKTTLGPTNSIDGTKTLEFTITLNKTQPPKKSSMKVFVTAKEGEESYEMKSVPYNFEVIQYGGLIDQHNVVSKIFGSADLVEFVNDANVPYEGIAKIENPLYRAFFTKTTPKGIAIHEDGKRYLSWNISLKSQESYIVAVRVNYISFVIFILVILIITALYFLLRSPIIITKSIEDVSTKDGGISKFKIILKVKNRSKNTVESISIFDRVPDIADFDKDAHVIGTLLPVKIVHTKRGVIAKWIISALGRQDETVITYKINSRLSVLGGMSLPLAVAKFETKKGRYVRSYSNRAKIVL